MISLPPCLKTRRRIAEVLAPTAMRRPISLVLCATKWDTTLARRFRGSKPHRLHRLVEFRACPLHGHDGLPQFASQRVGFLRGSVVLAVIGVALIVLAGVCGPNWEDSGLGLRPMIHFCWYATPATRKSMLSIFRHRNYLSISGASRSRYALIMLAIAAAGRR